MPFSTAGQLAQSVKTARATDSLGLVAENLRESPHGVLPVLDRPTFGPEDPNERNARVVGLISQGDLARASARLVEPVGASNGHAARPSSPAESSFNPSGPSLRRDSELSTNGFPGSGNSQGTTSETRSNESGAETNASSANVSTEQKTRISPLDGVTARDVMRTDVPYIPAAFSLHNALLTLDRYNLSALPVLDEANRFRGMISRADLLAAIARDVRPPLVGGMATPLGVYLTDGRLSGGAGPLGLFLSGLLLAVCLTVAQVVLSAVLWPLDRDWATLVFSGRLASVVTEGGWFGMLASIAFGLLFLTMMRLLPMSGTHAAEHQVVHTLERGLPLEPQYVSKMPRAHPRCGTNLMIVAGLMVIGISQLPDFGPEWVLPVLVFAFFFWRSVGTLVQEIFTTRTPSPRQTEQAIAAANELIRKYQAQPFAHPSLPLRLLNTGILWSALGMIGGLMSLQFGLLLLAQAILSR